MKTKAKKILHNKNPASVMDAGSLSIKKPYSVVYGNNAITLARLIATVKAL